MKQISKLNLCFRFFFPLLSTAGFLFYLHVNVNRERSFTRVYVKCEIPAQIESHDRRSCDSPLHLSPSPWGAGFEQERCRNWFPFSPHFAVHWVHWLQVDHSPFTAKYKKIVLVVWHSCSRLMWYSDNCKTSLLYLKPYNIVAQFKPRSRQLSLTLKAKMFQFQIQMVTKNFTKNILHISSWWLNGRAAFIALFKASV